jgi:2,3-oxidosqualene cyclase
MLPHQRARETGERAWRCLIGLQRAGGDWEGEMVWCTMILAQAVIVRTLLGRPYGEAEKPGILKHFRLNQLADGSWGMHPESPGYVFFTTLAYVALRLLGTPPDHSMLVRARDWLHAQPGGVKGIPSWGKFWLAMLGLYEYEGLNAIPPEIFLLPEWLPFHPSRYYCHTRQIYLGLAFLYGKRFRANLPDTLRDSLRRELYREAYEAVDFGGLRNFIAPGDVYVPVSAWLRMVYRLLSTYEKVRSPVLRERALGACLQRIVYEQRTSGYQGISPVSGLLNCLALFAHDPDHPDLAPSLEGVEAWRWEDEEEGIRYAGARSNTWDTAFAMQALLEAPVRIEGSPQVLQKARAFLEDAQMKEELPDRHAGWRDPALGGWCFSDGRHRWPVSDCAAEALSALLAYSEAQDNTAPLEPERLKQAIVFILSRQNRDGGFGTYERRRGGKLLELINPSEMFGQCMTELSYVECTASALGALAHYRKHYPDLPGGRIDRAISEAVTFLRRCQRDDGSYPGFWGINYTYAIFHVARGLRMAGVPPADPTLQKAARWLMGKQRSDGGWGEHYSGCLQGRFAEHRESQSVMTSWALLALLDILPPDRDEIRRGIRWLASRQQADGGWPRQAVNGVFFGAAMLDYRLYHTYFPAWAMARYVRLIGASEEACG